MHQFLETVVQVLDSRLTRPWGIWLQAPDFVDDNSDR